LVAINKKRIHGATYQLNNNINEDNAMPCVRQVGICASGRSRPLPDVDLDRHTWLHFL
jgi:hypothetical protein